MWLSSFRALLVFLDHTCLWRKQARVYHQWFPIFRWCNLWGNLSLYPRTSGLISHRSYSELFPRVGSFCPSDSRANISSSGEEEAMVAVHLLLDLLQQPHLLQPQPLQLSPSGPTVGHSLLSLSSVNILLTFGPAGFLLQTFTAPPPPPDAVAQLKLEQRSGTQKSPPSSSLSLFELELDLPMLIWSIISEQHRMWETFMYWFIKKCPCTDFSPTFQYHIKIILFCTCHPNPGNI